MDRFGACAAACALIGLLSGCLFHAGHRGLKEIRTSRPATPFARVVFKARPEAGEHGIEELHRTIAYWNGNDRTGSPRWRGILVPQPEDLYARVLSAIEGGEQSITLVSYKYDACGLESLTLVDYYDGAGRHFGFDYVAYADMPRRGGGLPCAGYDDLAWWEYPQLLLDIPVYALVGGKEFIGEIAKSPLSAIEGGWLGPPAGGFNPFSPVCFERGAGAFAEDWRNGFTALTWHFRVRSRHTPLGLVRQLLGIIPVVGPVFDEKSPPPDASRTVAPIVALSQGIYAGSDGEQHILPWIKATEELQPSRETVGIPYHYGGLMDTIWSLANLSHGMAYDAASQLIFDHGVTRAGGVTLVGFSGGVQRFVAATSILRRAGIPVDELVGVAGPTAPFSCAARSRILLGAETIEDPVVLSAHAVNLLFFLFPGNIPFVSVPDAGPHATPYFPNGATREPARGYAAALREALP
jgi:hypothetical protein